MTTTKAMHKCEEDFIQNWMNTLRRMRENRKGTGRSVRCRRLDLSSGDGILQHQKRVHFVRHGEGHHNVHSTVWFDQGKGGNPWEHPTCPIDPTLTDLGHEQARDLNKRGEALQAAGRFDPEVVVVSPLRRTLQTATLGFSFLKGKVPFVAQESCREIMGQHRCDRRIHSRFHAEAYDHVDFSNLHDFPSADSKQHATSSLEEASEEEREAAGDTVFNEWGRTRESDEAAVERALDFLFWLRDRPERDFVVVTHSAWLCVAFNGAMVCDCEDLQSWFNTGEIRSTLVEF